MTREQANKAKEITQNIDNVERILNFLNTTDTIIFTGDHNTLFPFKYSIDSNKLNTRLKTVIMDALTTIGRELEDELAEL